MNTLALAAPPWDLLVLTPLRVEFDIVRPLIPAALLRHRPYHVAECVLANTTLAIAQIGMGYDHAAKVTTWALEQYHPQRVLLAGLAGGLHPRLSTGTLVVATSVVTGLPDDCPVLLSETGWANLEATTGDLLCAAKALTTVAEKKSAFANTGCIAVDMESRAIADLCTRRAVPLTILRAIADDAHAELDPRLANLISPAGDLVWWRLLPKLCQPDMARVFWRMAGYSKSASAALQRGVRQVLNAYGIS